MVGRRVYFNTVSRVPRFRATQVNFETERELETLQIRNKLNLESSKSSDAANRTYYITHTLILQFCPVRLAAHWPRVPEAHHRALPVHAGRGRARGQEGAGVR